MEPAPERGERNEGRGAEGRGPEGRGAEWRDEARGERKDEAVIPVVPILIRQPVSLPVGQSTMPAPIGNPMSLPPQQSERVVSPTVSKIRGLLEL